MPTFADATRQVWNQLRPGWRSPQHAQLWLGSLERHAFPRIGEMPISEVTSADVIGILAPIWHDKAATARKLRQRIRAVMEWAVTMDLRPDNPCDRIGPVLGAQGKVVRHMRALPHGEVASAIETVRASNTRSVVKLVFEFLVLTAVRSGEEWLRPPSNPPAGAALPSTSILPGLPCRPASIRRKFVVRLRETHQRNAHGRVIDHPRLVAPGVEDRPAAGRPFQCPAVRSTPDGIRRDQSDPLRGPSAQVFTRLYEPVADQIGLAGHPNGTNLRFQVPT